MITEDLLELEADECPTCGGVGYLAIADRDDAEPCPNCHPEAGVFVLLTRRQRQRQFQDWADLN